MSAALTTERIQQRVSELGPWFHNLNLGGVQTAPDHFLGDYPAIKWQRFAHAIPEDLRGQIGARYRLQCAASIRSR